MTNPSLTHPDAATLGAYHDNELRGFAQADLQTHLEMCPRCRHALEEIDRFDSALQAMPTAEAPATIREAVLARVTNEHRVPRARARPLWRLAAALAALAAVILGYDILALPQMGASLSGSPVARRLQVIRSVNPPTTQHGVAMYRANDGARAQHSGTFSAASPATLAPAAVQQASAPHARRAAQPSETRLIVRTGEVNVRVSDVQKTFNNVSSMAIRQGGYVSDSTNNASAASQGGYVATLTLRVPAANFQIMMNGLVALTRHGLMREHASSADITDGYHDLQARRQALQATRAQLMALMRRAGSIRDAMTVLDRLTDVNTSIDAVQAQIMASDNSVALSTITVNLAQEPHRRHVVTSVRNHHHGQSSHWPGTVLGDALARLGRALQALATLAIYAVVYLALPLPLAALVLFTRRMWRRTLPSA